RRIAALEGETGLGHRRGGSGWEPTGQHRSQRFPFRRRTVPRGEQGGQSPSDASGPHHPETVEPNQGEEARRIVDRTDERAAIGGGRADSGPGPDELGARPAGESGLETLGEVPEEAVVAAA